MRNCCQSVTHEKLKLKKIFTLCKTVSNTQKKNNFLCIKCKFNKSAKLFKKIQIITTILTKIKKI